MLGYAKLKVLSAPKMVSHFQMRGESFGWVQCEVIEDSSMQYEVGYVSEFNGDFLRKI